MTLVEQNLWFLQVSNAQLKLNARTLFMLQRRRLSNVSVNVQVTSSSRWPRVLPQCFCSPLVKDAALVSPLCGNT